MAKHIHANHITTRLPAVNASFSNVSEARLATTRLIDTLLRRFRAAFSFVVALSCVSTGLANFAAAQVAPLSVSTVASGLHNPRGLNFGPDGALYVAEAAGDGVASNLCGVMSDRTTKCFGMTGSITRIDFSTGLAERILTSLPSLISPNGVGNSGTGIHDIAFQGLGNAYVTMGFGGDPTWRASYFGDFGSSFARLGRFNPSGNLRLYEDLGDYELDVNPDGGLIDTNPYGVLSVSGKVIYTDAGGNTLVQIDANGQLSTLAVFPSRIITRPNGSMVSIQSVPTSVALGPDGDLYVGELTGGPFTVGVARVYRVPIDGGTPEVAYSGFTNIIDIAFATDGSLYVLEIAKNAIPNFNPGRLVHVALDGTQTEIAAGLLVAPGGIAVGSDGILYVTNRSTSSTIGEVLRIEL